MFLFYFSLFSTRHPLFFFSPIIFPFFSTFLLLVLGASGRVVLSFGYDLVRRRWPLSLFTSLSQSLSFRANTLSLLQSPLICVSKDPRCGETSVQLSTTSILCRSISVWAIEGSTSPLELQDPPRSRLWFVEQLLQLPAPPPHHGDRADMRVRGRMIGAILHFIGAPDATNTKKKPQAMRPKDRSRALAGISI